MTMEAIEQNPIVCACPRGARRRPLTRRRRRQTSWSPISAGCRSSLRSNTGLRNTRARCPSSLSSLSSSASPGAEAASSATASTRTARSNCRGSTSWLPRVAASCSGFTAASARGWSTAAVVCAAVARRLAGVRDGGGGGGGDNVGRYYSSPYMTDSAITEVPGRCLGCGSWVVVGRWVGRLAR